MDRDTQVIVDSIRTILQYAYRNLFTHASIKGHWKSIRNTALATMCISFLEDGNSRWIDLLKTWITEQQTKDGTSLGSWNDEAWDTAMAVIALKDIGVSSKNCAINSAVQWLIKMFSHNGRYNLHDEPWETSWGMLALLRTGLPNTIDFGKSFEWLIGLQQENGLIVSPHYTAYFLMLTKAAEKVSLSPELQERIIIVAHKCETYLVSSLDESPDDKLWMNEGWANGQILLSLSQFNTIEITNSRLSSKLISWFKKNQDEDGGFSDIEDTASVILGLTTYFSLIVKNTTSPNMQVETEESFIYRLRKSVQPPLLMLHDKFVYRNDYGYYVIHIKASVLSKCLLVASIVITIISLSTNIISLWDYLNG